MRHGIPRWPLASLGLAPADPEPLRAPAECCRVCHEGKACGDSCIARDKQCHKPPGCACDG